MVITKLIKTKDPGSRIQKPGQRTLDTGPETQDLGCWTKNPDLEARIQIWKQEPRSRLEICEQGLDFILHTGCISLARII